MAADLDETHIQLSQRTTGLTSLPSELVGNILIYLPITPNLVDIGRASKAMASYIFNDFRFAHRHFHHQCNLKTPYPDLYIFHAKLFGSIWKSLPFNYQTVVFVHALASEHLKRDIVSPLYGFFNAKNWVYLDQRRSQPSSSYWITADYNTSSKLLHLGREILANPDLFDIRAKIAGFFAGKVDLTRYGDYALASACNEGHFEIVKLLLEDPSLEMGDAEEENEEEDEEEDEERRGRG
ncbi:hypothetical protein BCR33DRAFT_790168 [Rhizoclosmatium globosum]|uniref:F-box domain-containing protein n=1 Tax=Rhizoclosmatium globosum TaxID=329046 RepID=A0A1Y2BPN9_9FUNG|nr:hypothetical protein BCR33DRAFT_790168 [Rhizoclosmatium globosum]|eukprot:ORY36714.1 hypothetical protein BCR33DRAFT_790168 [Rhizoclosmatium globosum]